MVTGGFLPLSSIVDSFFAIWIYRGYSSSTLTSTSDETYGLLYFLPALTVTNYIIFNNIFPTILFTTLTAGVPEVDVSSEECKDSAGVVISCYEADRKDKNKKREEE